MEENALASTIQIQASSSLIVLRETIKSYTAPVRG